MPLLTQNQKKAQVADLSLYVDNSQSTMTGTNTSVVSNKLIDSSADFSTLKPHQVVVNTSDHTATIIDYVENDTTIVLKENIFTATPKGYSVDNHTGASSDKFKYPQSTMESVPANIDFYLHVYIADGTYSEISASDIDTIRGSFGKAFLFINKRMNAGGRIVVEGNTTTPANVLFNGTTPSAAVGVLVQDTQKVEVKGLKVTNCTHGIGVVENSFLTVSDTITNSNNNGFTVYMYSYVLASRIISGESGVKNTYGILMESSTFNIDDSGSGANSSSLRYNTDNINAYSSTVAVTGNATANVNLSDSTNWGVILRTCNTAILDRVIIDSASSGGAIQVNYEGNLSISNSVISNNSTRGITAYSNSFVYSSNNTGAGQSYGLVAQHGSVILKNGTQPTGTTSNEQTSTGGAIY